MSTWNNTKPHTAGVYNVIYGADKGRFVTSCYFDGTDTWYHDVGINHDRVVTDKIMMWQPLPELPKEKKMEEFVNKSAVLQMLHEAYADGVLSTNDGCRALYKRLEDMPVADVNALTAEQICEMFPTQMSESKKGNFIDWSDEGMKFMLESSNDTFKESELLDYVDKLYEAGYSITKYEKDFFINVRDFEDLKRICTIIEQFSVIIFFGTKGDEPTLEIYDGWRE